MNTEDAHLIEACCNQDREALHALYERFAPQMYGLLLRFAPSRAAAEDLLHDGFIKVFQNIKNLRNYNSLAGWIRSVMVHTAISAYRSEQQTSPVEEIDDNMSEVQMSADSMLENVDLDIILDAIRQLPSRYRLTFNLCEIEGYSSKEAADLLGINTVTVRSNLYRAKQILKHTLAPYFPQYNQNNK